MEITGVNLGETLLHTKTLNFEEKSFNSTLVVNSVLQY